MTDTLPQTSIEPSSQPPDAEEADAGFGITRVVIAAAAVLIGFVVVVVIAALAIAQGNVERLGAMIEIARDLVMIFLALEGILIILALAVLIVQVARLVNLFQNEVKPVLKNTQDTLKSAKGTVDFVSDTVAEPVIRASAFMSGLAVFVRDVGGIRRALRRSERVELDEAG